MKHVIAAGDKLIYKVACNSILEQSQTAQKNYIKNTFNSPGMGHPRMDYLCLNSELKERVHQKCTGLAMGDPLAETDD